MDLRKIGRGDEKWMELTQNRVQFRALVLMALNIQRISYLYWNTVDPFKV